MLKIANLLRNPISESLASQIQDLNCDLPKFFEFKKNLLNDNDITYVPKGTKCTLSFAETIICMGGKPPRIIPKNPNNSCVYQVNSNNEQLNSKEKQSYNRILKKSDNKYQKINEIQEIQNLDEENDQKWVYQDYDHSYDPIPKINNDYIYYFENKSQKKEIGLNDEYYYPVIAFRGVYSDRVFFFYGPSLFVVSNTKQIADAQMFVSRYSYGPFYLSSEFRSPSNRREKKLVRQMKKFFKKDCIYQQNPAIYPNIAESGLSAYGIDTAAYYIYDFVPMGDVINTKQIVEDFINSRLTLTRAL
ncbi:hypothetical protein TVAG_393080 [Trichomonas vaginalis G3]|uniref:Uncharacterized protein n=1 Tax=Trichomonas vaginalis (strain ATCC PRA-98 / G3) TaxID=412133 RepID=A2DYA4_TRIV3|nr:hypothetical protein TVAGG3_0281600 [Trichomonas vaginalis G3]EAY14581.1 hypothetical protein TVAG_393080 [Trichomonas vaginalis G3]KAI5526592.1 hypothetical protein TVAGG3_0281600 [Trichomonas vaginalis G3]|eukprot:XP_001326804.1 hypothetical protein [Trichomonas vaginalis G3]